MQSARTADRIPALFALCLAAPLAAVDLDAARAQLETVVARRDAALTALNARLAADRARGAFVDFKLAAEEMRHHRPLTYQLYARGEKVYGGIGFLKTYNQGTHRIDADGLTFADGVLSGTMTVILNPDPWVPADHRPRYQEHTVHAVVAEDGSVSGWYRYTGEFGPDKDRLTGTAEPVPATAAVDGPTGDEKLGEGLAGLKRTAALATTAYRQLRAASLAIRDYPASFERCLERNRTRDPFWDGNDPETAAHIATYLADLAAQAASWDLDRVDHTDYAVGFTHPADERFGPFFERSALAVGDDGVAELPPEAGQEGPQRWQYIDAWRIIGPFPSPNRTDHIDPQLPEMVRAPGAGYVMRTADIPNDRWIHPDWTGGGIGRKAFSSYTEKKWYDEWIPTRPAESVLREVVGTTASGRYEDSVLAPRWQATGTKIPIYGLNKSFLIATADLESPADLTVWAESKVLDAGQVWVNGRLAWHSEPDLAGHQVPKYAIFPIELREGVNRLAYRCRCDDTHSRFRLLLCTRGRPAAEEEIADTGPRPGEGAHFNYRGDGSSYFPLADDARPPVAWDVEAGTNLRWRVAMPSYSNASPVIVGDKILTNCEPHWLYCFDRASGKELWKVASSYAEVLEGEERADAEAALAFIGQKFQRQPDPEVERLKEERMALERRLQREADQLDEAELEKLRARSRELAEAIDARVGDRSRGMRVLKHHGVGAGGWHDWTGYTMPTPVTDGEHVWVKYSSGIVACYDLEGKRRWLVDTKLTGDVASCSSPVLVDGVLAVEGGIRKRARAAGLKKADVQKMVQAVGGEDLHWLVALDAATGEERWDTPVKCLPGGYGTPGGPRALALPLEGENVGVVVTQFAAFRAADGELLNLSTGTRPGHTGYVVGDVLVGTGLTRFWWEAPGQLGMRRILNGVGGSAVRVGDAFYSSPDPGMKVARTHVPWIDLEVVHAETGRRLHRVHPLAADAGSPNNYVPAAACGDLVYLTDGRCGALDRPGVRARIIVAKAGPPYEILARNELDSVTYSPPIFDAEGRMYVRTRRSLSCFENDGSAAAAKLAADRAVRELFFVKSRLPPVPDPEPVTAIAPPEGFRPAEGVPVVKLYERLGPDAWLRCGPFPTAPGTDHLAPLGGAAAARPEPGTAVGEASFRPLADEFMQVSRGLVEGYSGKRVFQYKTTIDLTRLAPGGNATNYLYTVVEVTRPRAVTYRNRGKSYRAWLAGTAIEHGQGLRLTPGYYPLMIEAPLGKLPPFGGIKVVMAPTLVEREDPVAALAAWQERVRPLRHRLEAALENDNGKWVFEAKRYLKKLDESPSSLTPPEPR